MDLKLTELNSVSFSAKIYQPFCLNSSTTQAHSLLSKTEIKIIDLSYQFLSDNDSIHFEIQTLSIDETAAPTEHIQKDLRQLMRQSTTEERHALLLDSVLIPSLSANPPNVRLIQHEWSPIGLFKGKCLLVTLTNFGMVDLFFREDADDCQIIPGEERKWNPLINITEIWTKSTQSTSMETSTICSSYQALRSRVDQMLIKCVCWMDRMAFNAAFISCFVEYGALVFFRVRAEMDTDLQESVDVNMVGFEETGQLKARIMKWLTIIGERKISILLCGCSNGQIVAYVVKYIEDGNRIEAKLLPDKLWAESDQIQVKEILTYFCEKTRKFFVLAVKGAHILLFLLNPDGKLIASEVFFGDHMEITGNFVVVFHQFYFILIYCLNRNHRHSSTYLSNMHYFG